MKELFTLFFTGRWKELFLSPTKNGWVNLFRYGFVGGGAFLVDFGLYIFLEWLGLHYLAAGVLSFIAGFIFNFSTGRILIFKAGSSARVEKKELISVLVISLIGLGLTEALLYAGVEWVRLDYRIAKMAAAILVLFWNYSARRIFVYK